jgi:3-hydroxyisobutyrate dehydrogenase-like beta-hydroxyacid dehydrogenase
MTRESTNRTEQRAAPGSVPAEPVTVVGLGRMGAALAGAFLNGGHATTVWNRDAAKADPLVARGAVRATTAAEAFTASRLVVICVLDNDAVRRLLHPLAGKLTGRVLVNLTTGTPAEARELAGWAAGQGAEYLDGAIMAIPQGVGGPEAVLLFSGSQAAFTAHRQALARLGACEYFGADAGLAALHDLALLSGMYGLLSGFFHGVALVGTERVTAGAFLPLATRMLAATLGFLPDIAREVDTRSYTTDVSSLQINAAALEMLVAVSRAQGIGVDVPAPLAALYRRAVDEGRAADSLASLVEVLRRPAAGGAAATHPGRTVAP